MGRSRAWSTRTQASFHYPHGIAVDGDGNIIDGNIIVADRNNHRIRKVAASLEPPCCHVPVARSTAFGVCGAQMEALLSDEALADVTVVGDARKGAPHDSRCPLRALWHDTHVCVTMLVSGKGNHRDIYQQPIRDSTPGALWALLRYLYFFTSYTDQLHFADEHLVDVMCKAKEISLVC
jgi:hypothetical protein